MDPVWEAAARKDLCEAFPRLSAGGFRVTSDPDRRYNCVSWALGETNRRWWPIPADDSSIYWPEDLPRQLNLPTLALLFERIGGYSPCADPGLEEGYEKIAVFATPDGHPTHVARQLPSGEWSSKMGQDLDIAHPLTHLEGRLYGAVNLVLRKPTR